MHISQLISEWEQYIEETITRPCRYGVEEVRSRSLLVKAIPQCSVHVAQCAPTARVSLSHLFWSPTNSVFSCVSVKDMMSVRCPFSHWRTLVVGRPLPAVCLGGGLFTPRALKVVIFIRKRKFRVPCLIPHHPLDLALRFYFSCRWSQSLHQTLVLRCRRQLISCPGPLLVSFPRHLAPFQVFFGRE